MIVKVIYWLTNRKLAVTLHRPTRDSRFFFGWSGAEGGGV